jgi:Fe(3+) dicitrate transport protein
LQFYVLIEDEMRKLMLLICAGLMSQCFAQSNANQPDSLPKEHKRMAEITIVGLGSKSDIHQLPEIVGTSIYAGKKNALIMMDNVKANVSTNTMRQVMAKVPGIHIWESDGSGIQIGVAARGLSPNRSWEFNVRQNGYDIAADPYGYPEAYYNPQLQAVQRIEIIRGHGSLQYGPQFGGMINYILRNGNEINKPFEVESQQTVGSFGMFNTYNAIGGETKKFHYYAYFDHRRADGWRDNSGYYTNSGFGTFTWRVNNKLSVTAEVMKNHINSQQPGGHTDLSFKADAKQSFRARNWMDISWFTTAMILNYQLAENKKINVKVFRVAGDRNSVGYIRPLNIADTINASTGKNNPRAVDIDQYRNYGVEARYLGDYTMLGMRNSLSGGIRYFHGNTYRYRDGVGTTGSDYTLERTNTLWPRDIDYKTNNVAAFAENIFRISEKFLVVPGLRYEWIDAAATGINGYVNGQPVFLQNQQRQRGFLLAGIGAEYHTTDKTEFYANITQAYRPMQFADLTAPPTTNEIDANLQDAKGFNADLGYRGRIGSWLYFDASAFFLQYNNRIGTIIQQRADGSFYNLTTNVGNSRSKGLEAVVEFSPVKAFLPKSKWGDVRLFASYSYTEAKYASFEVVQRVGNDLVKSNLSGKYVENAPLNILRAGLTYTYKGFSATGQLSYVDKAYSDANNTETPTANGQNGVIPAYTIGDLFFSYSFAKYITLKAGVNNLTNAMYFTRRAGGYPGPGLLPADGRNVFLSVGAKF